MMSTNVDDKNENANHELDQTNNDDDMSMFLLMNGADNDDDSISITTELSALGEAALAEEAAAAGKEPSVAVNDQSAVPSTVTATTSVSPSPVTTTTGAAATAGGDESTKIQLEKLIQQQQQVVRNSNIWKMIQNGGNNTTEDMKKRRANSVSSSSYNYYEDEINGTPNMHPNTMMKNGTNHRKLSLPLVSQQSPRNQRKLSLPMISQQSQSNHHDYYDHHAPRTSPYPGMHHPMDNPITATDDSMNPWLHHHSNSDPMLQNRSNVRMKRESFLPSQPSDRFGPVQGNDSMMNCGDDDDNYGWYTSSSSSMSVGNAANGNVKWIHPSMGHHGPMYPETNDTNQMYMGAGEGDDDHSGYYTFNDTTSFHRMKKMKPSHPQRRCVSVPSLLMNNEDVVDVNHPASSGRTDIHNNHDALSVGASPMHDYHQLLARVLQQQQQAQDGNESVKTAPPSTNATHSPKNYRNLGGKKFVRRPSTINNSIDKSRLEQALFMDPSHNTDGDDMYTMNDSSGMIPWAHSSPPSINGGGMMKPHNNADDAATSNSRRLLSYQYRQMKMMMKQYQRSLLHGGPMPDLALFQQYHENLQNYNECDGDVDDTSKAPDYRFVDDDIDKEINSNIVVNNNNEIVVDEGYCDDQLQVIEQTLNHLKKEYKKHDHIYMQMFLQQQQRQKLLLLRNRARKKQGGRGDASAGRTTTSYHAQDRNGAFAISSKSGILNSAHTNTNHSNQSYLGDGEEKIVTRCLTLQKEEPWKQDISGSLKEAQTSKHIVKDESSSQRTPDTTPKRIAAIASHLRETSRRPFPVRLMDALKDLDESKEHIVGWLPDQKSICIVNPERFLNEIIQPPHFPVKRKNGVLKQKFESFVRRLSRWGFVRLGPGTGTDCFYHPYFRKDHPEWVSKVQQVVHEMKQQLQQTQHNSNDDDVAPEMKSPPATEAAATSSPVPTTSPADENGNDNVANSNDVGDTNTTTLANAEDDNDTSPPLPPPEHLSRKKIVSSSDDPPSIDGLIKFIRLKKLSSVRA